MNVAIKIRGGLGNQLFQYAAAKSIALDNDSKLFLDVGWFNSNQERIYELPNFNIQYDEKVFFSKAYNFIFKKYAFLRYDNNAKMLLNIFKEKSLNFQSEVQKIKSSIYLDGYFQSEKYFIRHENEIRKNLQFSVGVCDGESIFEDQISESESVSIHIRRGDYVTNKEVADFHGLLEMDYYNQSIDFIKSKVEKPVFFVFTDDPDWVVENFSRRLAFTLVRHNQAVNAGIRDLRLMSLCKHNIIANSSFSWWGSWLNVNHKKIVISPKKWFKKSETPPDLIPSTWMQI